MIPQALEDAPRIQQERVGSTETPAPVRGLNTVDPLPNMALGYAIQMDNWIPRQYHVEARGGMHSVVTMFAAVRSLLSYGGSRGKQLLAVSNSKLFVIDPIAETSTEVPHGLFPYESGVRYTQFAAGGQPYCVMILSNAENNSVDAYAYTNVSALTTPGNFSTINTPAGFGILTNVASIKGRLWYTVKNSQSVWYGGVGFLTGGTTEFPLTSYFKKGGAVVNISSWSVDGGAGLDDLTTFITSEGEVAVYSGTDPASASTWTLVGIYQIPKPIGFDCTQKYGGDLLVNTVSGPYLMSKALLNANVLNQANVGEKISNSFSSLSASYQQPGWQMELFAQQKLLFVNAPGVIPISTLQFVMNTVTGAWCRFTGISALCLREFNDELYAGVGVKVVKLLQNGSNDLGSLITASLVAAYNKLGQSGRNKEVKMIKPIIEVQGNVNVELAQLMDYATVPAWYAYGALPNSTGVDVWDTGLWDTAVWAEEMQILRNLWYTVPNAPGRATAWGLRCTYGTANILKLSAYDLVYETGGIM